MKRLVYWLTMGLGAVMIFISLSILFTGFYAGNALIIITGIIGSGLGTFLIRHGYKSRKILLAAVKK